MGEGQEKPMVVALPKGILRTELARIWSYLYCAVDDTIYLFVFHSLVNSVLINVLCVLYFYKLVNGLNFIGRLFIYEYIYVFSNDF